VNSIVQIALIINPPKASIVKMKLIQQSFFYHTAATEAKMHTQTLKSVLAITFLLALTTAAFGDQHRVGQSPWGADDEIGRLNLITEQSRSEILSRISGGRSYDLSVEYFIGMPSWQAAGDPHYRIWMTHTPGGTVVDDPLGVGQTMNEHVSYTGSAVSMYTHTGTHIDSLNHFGLDGKIWNGFSAADHLGDRGWQVAGAENIPPIIARGVLIDVATAKGVDMLADGYRVTRDDLINALGQQGVELHEGDVVLIRTGWMKLYEDASAFMANSPGLGMAAAKFLVEENGAMIVGADNLSFEAFPSEVDGNYVPIHTYLLAQHGVPILELVNLEGLAEDRVYEFAFVGASLKLRGADAAPIRPIAFPVH
jgi:kynurenine formamidase